MKTTTTAAVKSLRICALLNLRQARAAKCAGRLTLAAYHLKTALECRADAASLRRTAPAPRPPAGRRVFEVEVLVDEHVVAVCEVTATSPTAAMAGAIDRTRAKAISLGKPDLTIEPWAIRGSRAA